MPPFFEDLPDQPDWPPRLQPRREPWRGTSADTLGVPVPLVVVMARTSEVALIVGGFVAYPAGFGFSLTSIGRMNPADVAHGVMGHPAQISGTGVVPLRFGIGFANGAKVTNQRLRLRPPSATPPGQPTLSPRGGGGAGRKFTQSYWCEPLPPRGPLTFVCEWSRFDIAETERVIDAGTILDAAERATPIWPEDVGLEDPGPPPPMPFWSGYPRD